MNIGQHILVGTLRLYRRVVSPVLGAVTGPMGLGCRFTPTCSQFALEAVQRHGVLKGGILALGRLCRCHPWGGYGFDPVPPGTARVSPPAAKDPEGQRRITTVAMHS